MPRPEAPPTQTMTSGRREGRWTMRPTGTKVGVRAHGPYLVPRWRRTFTANTELVTDEEGRER
jgi:hypothetical protein